MIARTLPRVAVDGTLKLLRLPVESTIRLLPGNRTGSGAAAELAVDRADAALRAFFATVLGDPMLRQDAQRRRTAAQKRDEALDLREAASRINERSDSRLDRQHEQAERQREQADQRAKAQRERTDRKRQAKLRNAAQTEGKRLAASKRAASQAAKAADRRADRQRLKSLDTKAEALGEQEQALAAGDEAKRLGEAAGRTKGERKTRPNGQKR